MKPRLGRILIFLGALALLLLLVPPIRAYQMRQALLAAIHTYNHKQALRLLDLGADPEAADPDRRAAIHYAAFYDWTDVVRRMVALGVDPDRPDSGGITPLMLAIAGAQGSRSPTATALLELGASPQARDAKGETVLQLAERMPDKEMAAAIRSLLKHGPAPHQKPVR